MNKLKLTALAAALAFGLPLAAFAQETTPVPETTPPATTTTPPADPVDTTPVDEMATTSPPAHSHARSLQDQNLAQINFDDLDSNKTGTISRSDAAGQPELQRVWNDIDSDNDSVVSRAEFDAYVMQSDDDMGEDDDMEDDE